MAKIKERRRLIDAGLWRPSRATDEMTRPEGGTTETASETQA